MHPTQHPFPHILNYYSSMPVEYIRLTYETTLWDIALGRAKMKMVVVSNGYGKRDFKCVALNPPIKCVEQSAQKN
jgi:hypothetical protein